MFGHHKALLLWWGLGGLIKRRGQHAHIIKWAGFNSLAPPIPAARAGNEGKVLERSGGGHYDSLSLSIHLAVPLYSCLSGLCIVFHSFIPFGILSLKGSPSLTSIIQLTMVEEGIERGGGGGPSSKGYDFTNYSKSFRFGGRDSSAAVSLDLSLANLFQKLTVECR